MLDFALTQRLRDAVELVLPSGEAATLARYARADARTISLEHVQLLSSMLRQQQHLFLEPPESVWVHELLQGAAPQLPAPPAKREPHPDLAPRLERLKAAQANREYAAMLGDVHCASGAEREEAEMVSYKSQLGVGLNLIVSMGTMFVVGHYAGGTKEEPNGPRAVICGLVLCILTMLVEVTLFVIGASRVDAKSHRRAQAAAKAVSSDLTKRAAGQKTPPPRGRTAAAALTLIKDSPAAAMGRPTRSARTRLAIYGSGPPPLRTAISVHTRTRTHRLQENYGKGAQRER